MTDIPEYDDLKLRIEAGDGDSYRVVAFGPGGNTATGRFARPISQVELDNFILRVGLPRRHVRKYRSSQMEEAKQLGTQLFESLLAADVGDLYHGARSVADSRSRGLRMTLYLTGVPELMEIPWEFLYDPGDAFFLSQSMYTPLVRSLDLRSASPPRKLTLPMKVLGMASAPQGFPGLDVDDEREKLARALEPLTSRGAVELEWLDSATLAELDRRVGNPDELHVIHYIGHGAYDDRTQSGILVLEDSTGGVHEVTGEELGGLLRDERSLRLVVLNSCEGARTSHVDPFSGVASSLLRCGLPAVVGMQAEITDEAAITFSERLYTALAQGFPIDAALTQARKAIFAAGSDVEFGTPVLFLRGENAQLFDVEGAEKLEELPVIELEPEPQPKPQPKPDEQAQEQPEPPPAPPPPPPRKLLPWALAGAGVVVAAGLAFALLSGGGGGGDAGGGGSGSGDTIHVGSGPVDLTAAAGAVWTSNQTTGDISKVDPASRKEVDRSRSGRTLGCPASPPASTPSGCSTFSQTGCSASRRSRKTRRRFSWMAARVASGWVAGVCGSRSRPSPHSSSRSTRTATRSWTASRSRRTPRTSASRSRPSGSRATPPTASRRCAQATHRRRSRSAPPPTTWPWAPARSGSRIARTTRSLASTYCSRASTRGCAPAAGPRAWRPTTATSGW